MQNAWTCAEEIALEHNGRVRSRQGERRRQFPTCRALWHPIDSNLAVFREWGNSRPNGRDSQQAAIVSEVWRNSLRRHERIRYGNYSFSACSTFEKAMMVGSHRERLPVLLFGVQRHPEFLRPAFMLQTFASSRDSGTAPCSARGSRADMHDHLSDSSHLCPGTILLTGYLGGAVLTHLRVGEPVFMPLLPAC